MKIKLFSIFLISCSFILLLRGISFAQVTVEEIIAKVNAQDSLIKDVKATVEVSFVVMNKNVTQSSIVLAKKPNKFKSISLDGSGQMISFDGRYSYYKLSKSAPVEKKEQVSNVTTPTLSHPLLNWQAFLEGYNCKLFKVEDPIYKIELTPKTASTNSLSKNEIWLDYEKGSIKKIVFYVNGAESVMEVKEHCKYGDIYFPSVFISKQTTSMGTIIFKMAWKNIQINKGISDGEFVIK